MVSESLFFFFLKEIVKKTILFKHRKLIKRNIFLDDSLNLFWPYCKNLIFLVSKSQKLFVSFHFQIHFSSSRIALSCVPVFINL